MSLEISPDEPIVSVMAQATADVGRPSRLSGLDSWYDGATLTRLGGTPSIAYGPPGFEPDGRSVAHTIDEHVPVDGPRRLRAGARRGGDALLRRRPGALEQWSSPS